MTERRGTSDLQPRTEMKLTPWTAGKDLTELLAWEDIPRARSFMAIERDRHSYFHSSSGYETCKSRFKTFNLLSLAPLLRTHTRTHLTSAIIYKKRAGACV